MKKGRRSMRVSWWMERRWVMELSITMTLNESSMKAVSVRENDLAGECCMIEMD